MHSRVSHEPDAVPLSLLYTVIFVEIGVAMPFMPVWLNALGLEAEVIGLLVALPIIVRIVATAPLLSLIDRGVAARTLLLCGSLAVAMTYGLMPFTTSFWPLLAVLIAANAIAGAPLVPSIDYLTLSAVRHSARIDYARVRLSGSVGFLAANLVGGALLGLLGERVAVPILLTGLALIAATVAYASRGLAESGAQPQDGHSLRLPRTLVLMIAATALIQATHAAVYAFGSIYWTTHGIGPSWVGALWAIGVAAEIVLFAIVGRLPSRWREPQRLLALGGGAAVLRALGMSILGDQLAVLPLLQALHGLTFGATHLGAMTAVSQLAPDGARGRAQGTVSAATALASASSTLGCGFVYGQAGGPATFAAMMPLALAGLGVVAIAARRIR